MRSGRNGVVSHAVTPDGPGTGLEVTANLPVYDPGKSGGVDRKAALSRAKEAREEQPVLGWVSAGNGAVRRADLPDLDTAKEITEWARFAAGERRKSQAKADLSCEPHLLDPGCQPTGVGYKVERLGPDEGLYPGETLTNLELKLVRGGEEVD